MVGPPVDGRPTAHRWQDVAVVVVWRRDLASSSGLTPDDCQAIFFPRTLGTIIGACREQN
jgi:hypothetical protein